MSDKTNKDRNKEKEESLDYRRSQSGNHLAILFLLVPAAGMIWALREKAPFPIDQVDFLIKSFLYIVTSFAVLWVLAYLNVKRGRNLLAVSAFFLLLWMITGTVIVAKINVAFDESAEKTYYMKALATRTISSSGSKPTPPRCIVSVDKKYLNVDAMTVKYNECESIRPNIDGLLVKVKDGILGMPWMVDHSIIKDYDLYKTRLGITD